MNFQQGFTGALCEKPTTVCDSVECQNGGHCDVEGTTFKCKCPYGWTGDYCQFNVDECASNPCQHGGQCIDKKGKIRNTSVAVVANLC